MFGETSLLKASPATASVAIDSDEAVVVSIEGEYVYLPTSPIHIPCISPHLRCVSCLLSPTCAPF